MQLGERLAAQAAQRAARHALNGHQVCSGCGFWSQHALGTKDRRSGASSQRRLLPALLAGITSPQGSSSQKVCRLCGTTLAVESSRSASEAWVLHCCHVQASLEEVKAKALETQRELDEVHHNLAAMQGILGMWCFCCHV
jgi:hypothetical protein